MRKLEELINLFESDERVKRYKLLEEKIQHNSSLLDDYQALLKTQKLLVQQTVSKHKNLELTEQKYMDQLKKMEGNVFFSEYIDLQNELNEDLQLIKKIIEESIGIE